MSALNLNNFQGTRATFAYGRSAGRVSPKHLFACKVESSLKEEEAEKKLN